MLGPDVLEYIDRSVLCWLATVDRDGAPNVSPKEVFAALDERRLAIASIASPGSARNVRANPTVCVSFVDVFVQKGYKIRGRAHLVSRSDPRFAEVSAPLESITGGVFPIRAVFEVEVTSVEEIVAPSYRLFPDTTEASQIESAMRTYGVRPADRG